MARVLLACEESQAVTIEMRKLGLEAFSCDLETCSGGYPEWHLQCDVFTIIENDWDMMLAFPPCTHLAVSGARYFEAKRKDGRQQQGVDFFLKLINAPIAKIAVENPVGIMSSIYRKPDQIIQPWMFGDEFTKTTCLWLKNLPRLKPTNIVGKGTRTVYKSGKSHPAWYADALKLSPKERAKVRSKTFHGIASAMAIQWGGLLV
jgi:site-specific DNA-cytosine methylase